MELFNVNISTAPYLICLVMDHTCTHQLSAPTCTCHPSHTTLFTNRSNLHSTIFVISHVHQLSASRAQIFTYSLKLFAKGLAICGLKGTQIAKHKLYNSTLLLALDFSESRRQQVASYQRWGIVTCIYYKQHSTTTS